MDVGFSLLHKKRRTGIAPISLHEAVAVEIEVCFSNSIYCEFVVIKKTRQSFCFSKVLLIFYVIVLTRQ